MTGYAVRGRMGFVAKEGVTLDTRLNVRLHSDERGQMDRLRDEGESAADFIRTALRKELLYRARKQGRKG